MLKENDNMMISPESFVERLKDKTYDELLIERENLISSIKGFEKNHDSIERDCIPDPEVVYQCELEYLGQLCYLISEKYNRIVNDYDDD